MTIRNQKVILVESFANGLKEYSAFSSIKAATESVGITNKSTYNAAVHCLGKGEVFNQGDITIRKLIFNHYKF